MVSKNNINFHESIVLGVELESYTISIPDYYISRELAFPKRGVVESGERFARDASIGTEYNSKPFSTIHEGLFLLKAGLRKYNVSLYRSKSEHRRKQQLLLVGGWRDRYAGAHIHVSIKNEELSKNDARSLAFHLHDHIPLFIACGANSPVWADEITRNASNRVACASKMYFKPIRRGELTSRLMDEMTFSRGRRTKPPTLELRILDSNIPEYVMAIACLVKAVCLAWLSGKKAKNKIGYYDYIKSRKDAALRGMNSRLCWKGQWLTAPKYLDKFIWEYREEFWKMDLSEDIFNALKLLKKRMSGSSIIHQAATIAYREHPQTWQKRFAKRYSMALESLLEGNGIDEFAKRLEVKLPNLEKVWLGRSNLKL